MHTEPRRGPIEVLVLHDNEGPQGPNAAASLAGYLQHIDGGYHAIFDNQNTVTVVSDATEVWGNGGINSRSLDGCLIGYASGQWTDPYSVAEIQRAVLWCAAKCRQYGIPPVHLTPLQVATPGVKGICRHWDVTLAGFSGSAGHTDPGQNFPIEDFVRRVANQLAPPKPKVAPMYDPPLQIVAELINPQGGRWQAHPHGKVDYIYPDGRKIEGGMVSSADRRAFVGRSVAQLEIRWYRTGPLRLRKAGYTIIATSGERYIPENQH